MSFWRKEVIDFALNRETSASVEEQLRWIDREPSNPVPYYQLAQLLRIQWKQDDALALLLQAISLEPRFGDAHVALAEIYAVRMDYPAAWRHARAAADAGNCAGVELLTRHGVPE